MKKLVLLGATLLLQAAGYGQLQNTSFEVWENPIDSPFGNRPLGWMRTNGIPMSEAYYFYHGPVTPAQEGDYALRLSIWYTYDKDMARQVAPIDYRPAAMTGFYTYTDNLVQDNMSEEFIGDVAKATVRLTKEDPTTGGQILIGLGVLSLAPSPTFAAFTCTIDYVSDLTPDTIEVIFDCSLLDKTGGSPVTAPPGSGVCSILTIDNIALTAETLSNKEFLLEDIKVYPNPATSVVHVSGFEGEATLYDTMGKQVGTTYTTGSIDISAFANGVYILSLTNENGTRNINIIKQ